MIQFCFVYRYASAQAAPQVDGTQSITNYSAVQDGNNRTIIKFTRAATTNDDSDVNLNQPVYILYASGSENNYDGSDQGSIMQHGMGTANRGISPNTVTILCAGMKTLTNMQNSACDHVLHACGQVVSVHQFRTTVEPL